MSEGTSYSHSRRFPPFGAATIPNIAHTTEQPASSIRRFFALSSCLLRSSLELSDIQSLCALNASPREMRARLGTAAYSCEVVDLKLRLDDSAVVAFNCLARSSAGRFPNRLATERDPTQCPSCGHLPVSSSKHHRQSKALHPTRAPLKNNLPSKSCGGRTFKSSRGGQGTLASTRDHGTLCPSCGHRPASYSSW